MENEELEDKIRKFRLVQEAMSRNDLARSLTSKIKIKPNENRARKVEFTREKKGKSPLHAEIFSVLKYKEGEAKVVDPFEQFLNQAVTEPISPIPD